MGTVRRLAHKQADGRGTWAELACSDCGVVGRQAVDRVVVDTGRLANAHRADEALAFEGDLACATCGGSGPWALTTQALSALVMRLAAGQVPAEAVALVDSGSLRRRAAQA